MQEKGESLSIDFTLIDPKGNSYEIRLSPTDSPMDLKAYLTDFAPLSYYTNYSLESNSQLLSDYLEFSEQTVSGPVYMKLNPYNERSSKAHIKRFRDILKSPPSVTSQIVKSSQKAPEFQESSPETPPPFSMEELILQPMLLTKPPSRLNPWKNEEETLEVPQCIQFISFDEFNPPNNKRRLAGDLSYLVIRTMEGEVLHITSSASGFYVNSSESGKSFKPEPAADPKGSKTLPDLLSKSSSLFRESFDRLLSIGYEWNILRNQNTVHPTPTWQGPTESNPDPDSFIMRDWNEEFQMVRSLPVDSPLHRIQRDKALGKIYSDFVEAAISGAKGVVHGYISPLNPMDLGSQQLFVYNHIFFSFTEDLEYIVMYKQSNNKAQTHVLHMFQRT